MNMQIRPFSPSADRDLFVEAERAALLDTGFQDDALVEQLRASLERIETQLEAGAYLGLTAIEDGMAIGLVLIDRDPDVAFIDNLYVVPQKRRKGVGQELIRHTIRELKRRNIKSVELMVTAENQAAIGLYEKSGFDVSRFRMRRELSSADV